MVNANTGSVLAGPCLEQVLTHLREIVLIAQGVPGDPVGPRVVFSNTATAKLATHVPALVGGAPLLVLRPAMVSADVGVQFEQAVREGKSFSQEVQLRSSTGETWFRLDCMPLSLASGEVLQILLLAEDTSDQRREQERCNRLQAQLFQSQKLETIGVLASGVAHDFNNILTGVVGSAELIKMTLPQPHPAHDDLDNIMHATQRAAALTRELLVYATSGKAKQEVINLNQAVTSILVIMRSQMSRSIIVRKALTPDVPNVEADPVEVQQVMVNLCLNASEAMKDHGGVLTITTDRVVLDAEQARHCSHLQPTPGAYAVFEVSDTGAGIDPQKLQEIFTPFYTTKRDGRGLGLAVAYDIVRRQHGGIDVESEPGQGTTIRVFLPASSKRVPERGTTAASASTGTQTILFVDDEEVLRSLAQRALERFGYRVLLAADGIEAVRMFKEHADEIDLVVLDLSMPRKGGEDAFQEIHAVRPDMKILLCCGYNEATAQTKIAGDRIVAFLPKPFGIDALVNTVQAALRR